MFDKRGKGAIFHGAVGQIGLLVIAIIAFAFLIGQMGVAGAQPYNSLNTLPTKTNGYMDWMGFNYKSPKAPNTKPNVLPGDPSKAKLGGFGPQFSGASGYLVQGINYAIIAVGIIQLVGNLAGLDSSLTNSLSAAVGAGILAGRYTYGLATLGKAGFGNFASKTGLTHGQFGFAVGAVIAIGIFVAMYKKEETQLVRFECLPWQPPLKGLKCEECNKNPQQPCTEYRCKALGQACELLNKGTGKEKCSYVSVNDVKSPIISTWKDVLLPGELKYEPDNSIRPPAIGVKISSSKSDKCLPAFTPLQFGILTDEPAQCKIDFNLTQTFDQMQFFFGESNLFEYNHTQKMRLPAPDADSLGSESPLIKNGGKMTLFARCRDANGNFNPDPFAISYCIDSGPDTTPPIIEGFSIPSGGFIQYNADKVPIEVYTNEPSDCKWSIQDKTYETMENVMKCSATAIDLNADLVYTCTSEITGVKNREDNKYYFRCKDNPSKQEKDRNVNVKSASLVLKGSQPLTINSVEPNGTIKGSTNVIKVDLEVVTTNGAEDGKAVCSYRDSNAKDEFLEMFETKEIRHKQTLTLHEGSYTYDIKCLDAGGNSAESKILFNVKVDKNAPVVTRAYRFNNEALRIISDENATCVYSLTSCNYEFDKGIPLIQSPPSVQNAHLTEWKDSVVYHIKCNDLYGNQPDPNKCSIVASASQIAKGTQI